MAHAAPARSEEDKGETKELKALKSRARAPKPAEIDPAATLDALLTKTGPSDWSTSKGATIEGIVVQAEREEDGDLHLVLAPKGGERDTKKWVIVEATAAWQKKKVSLSRASLKKLVGTTVKATGWLFYEPDDESKDPRGTNWEIHPATDISAAR
ncbi:MAG: hypothetical protein ABIQ65_05570 [Thermoanaerobaculia bacterium]